MAHEQERRVFEAMIKFSNLETLTDQEFNDLSLLSLINRKNLDFREGNIRWAQTEDERLDNLKFYQSFYKREDSIH